MFFKPLERVRQKRYDATEGAREHARANMERAAARTAEYEAALRMAKAAVYQSQETLYRQLEEQQEAQLEAARREADSTVDEARAALAQDVDAAKERLARNSEALARQIAESILRRSAA
jgi:F-type H+-transporting ATPase subunit b